MKLRLFLSLLISVVSISSAYAVDADGDGSDAVEEALAGTSDNDATQRPYWWKTVNGDSAGDNLGYSVSGAGDVNGDGTADFMAGAYEDTHNGYGSGSARVYSGVDGSVLYTVYGDNEYGYLGASVSGAGDVNADGYADFMAGAYGDATNGWDSGMARVYSGVDGSLLYTVYGESENDALGVAVSGAGDVNKDGYADFMVGARGDENGLGSARVYSGVDGSLLYTVYGDIANGYLGLSVSGAGDVNADGYADFMAGAPWSDNINGNYSGLARVYSGVDGSVLYTVSGDSAEDFLGMSVSGAGDVNKDGAADFMVGAIWDDNNGFDSGSVRVYSGADGSVLYSVYGDEYEELGNSVSGAGDVNKDGYADFMAGSFGSRSVRVYSGADGSMLYAVNGNSAGGRFGYSVSGTGDVDGDGAADFMAGAPWSDNNNGADPGSARIYLSSNLMSDPDLDFIVNSADVDDDNDGVLDGTDNCRLVRNANQLNTDGDTQGDICDKDDDDDGIPDAIDAQLLFVPLTVNGVYKGSAIKEHHSLQ